MSLKNKLLNLEKNIERLKASEYCPYDKKCGQLYECTKEEYQNMCNANTKLSLENDNLRYRLENAIADCQLRLKEVKKQKEVIDKVGATLNECKLLMPHEFDWQEQVDYVLDILKEVSK